MSAPQNTVPPTQDAVPPPQNSMPPPDATITANPNPPPQPDATTAAAAPGTNTGTAKPGPIDNRDVEEWTQRFNKALAKPGDTLKSKSPAGAEAWKNSFFACFTPVSLCAVTCCLPCITFGKTHHRLNRDPNLEGYQAVNTSCLLLLASSCLGLFCLPLAIQRAEIRERFNLEGSCMSDLARAYCCGCCDLMQQEKEVAERAPLVAPQGVKEAYQAPDAMAYPAPAPGN